MDFFSDSELGKKPATNNEIGVSVWNGLAAIIDSYIAGNYLSEDFPEQCPDGLGVYACDKTLLNDKLKALIPGIEIPIRRKDEFANSEWGTPTRTATIVDTYSTLDLIEFCYSHISDPVQKGKLHTFFNHHHLSFNESGNGKTNFRSEINKLFERNGIAYFLSEGGKISRVMAKEFQQILKHTFSTTDSTLNDLLAEATESILLPRAADRMRAVERLWDAFERAKTFYGANKKVSATQLISLVANGNSVLEAYLTTEAATLTDIGNKFQIRHFETDKQPITDIRHVDYLFFRMLSIIDLFIKELEK